LQTLEKKSETFVTADYVKQIISTETLAKQQEQKSVQSVNDTQVGDVVKEMNEREKRRNNAIMFHVPEPKTNIKAERISEDIKIVQALGKAIDIEIDNEHITKVTRIGKKTQTNNENESLESNDNTNCRPLLVTFSNEDAKKNLLQNISKLKEITVYLSEISVDHDMMPKEREETKTLLAEAKEKEDKSSGKYKYRVRGPPWNRYIKRMPVE